MSYQRLSTWEVARQRRAQGLGDTSYTVLPGYTDSTPAPPTLLPQVNTPAALPSTLDPFAANPVIAGDIAAGFVPPGASDTSPSGVLASLTALASAVGTAAGQGVSPLQAQTNAALANPPSTIPSWVIYGGIGLAAVLVLGLLSGGRRR